MVRTPFRPTYERPVVLEDEHDPTGPLSITNTRHHRDPPKHRLGKTRNDSRAVVTPRPRFLASPVTGDPDKHPAKRFRFLFSLA